MGISRTIHILALLATSLAASDGTLAVLDLDARGVSVVEAASLTDRLRSELVKTGRVTIVERGAMEQILREQDFQMAGCTSDECAVEVGQLLGVTQMLAGSIGKVGSTYSIDLRIIDVESGTIIQSVTHDYRGEIDDLLGQMATLAQQLVGIEPEAPPVAAATQPAPSTSTPDAQKRGGSTLRWLLLGSLAVGTVAAGLAYAGSGEPPLQEIGAPPGLPPAP